MEPFVTVMFTEGGIQVQKARPALTMGAILNRCGVAGYGVSLLIGCMAANQVWGLGVGRKPIPPALGLSLPNNYPE